jgi:hypothetical protein
VAGLQVVGPPAFFTFKVVGKKSSELWLSCQNWSGLDLRRLQDSWLRDICRFAFYLDFFTLSGRPPRRRTSSFLHFQSCRQKVIGTPAFLSKLVRFRSQKAPGTDPENLNNCLFTICGPQSHRQRKQLFKVARPLAVLFSKSSNWCQSISLVFVKLDVPRTI